MSGRAIWGAVVAGAVLLGVAVVSAVASNGDPVFFDAALPPALYDPEVGDLSEALRCPDGDSWITSDHNETGGVTGYRSPREALARWVRGEGKDATEYRLVLDQTDRKRYALIDGNQVTHVVVVGATEPVPFLRPLPFKVKTWGAAQAERC